MLKNNQIYGFQQKFRLGGCEKLYQQRQDHDSFKIMPSLIETCRILLKV